VTRCRTPRIPGEEAESKGGEGRHFETPISAHRSRMGPIDGRHAEGEVQQRPPASVVAAQPDGTIAAQVQKIGDHVCTCSGVHVMQLCQFLNLRSIGPGLASERGRRCCTSWRPSTDFPIRDRCALIGASRCRSSPALPSASSPVIRSVRWPARPLTSALLMCPTGCSTGHRPRGFNVSTSSFCGGWDEIWVRWPRARPPRMCCPHIHASVSVAAAAASNACVPSVHRRVRHATPGADSRDLMCSSRRPSL
jgi:hypothetical protein